MTKATFVRVYGVLLLSFVVGFASAEDSSDIDDELIKNSLHDEALYDEPQYDNAGDDYYTELTSMDKRAGVRPVPYPCNGYDHLPRCLHGGRGPRKTMTKAGQFCVCLCPNKWIGPECGYAAENMGKRTYPWKIISQEEEKRTYPWKINTVGKRTFPWEIVAKGGKRNVPWKLMSSSTFKED